MPRATLNLEPEHHDLKTCPEGWVKLRRMTYGELLQSQDMAFQVSMQRQQVKQAADQGKEPDVDLKVSQAAISVFQLGICIVNHNLEDEHDNMLNFRNANDVNRLDPRVGQEIMTLVDAMHDWQAQYPNSEKPSTTASPEGREHGMATEQSTPAELPKAS